MTFQYIINHLDKPHLWYIVLTGPHAELSTKKKLEQQGRFLWSAHRITERQKAGKARNIKGKQLKNSRSTV